MAHKDQWEKEVQTDIKDQWELKESQVQKEKKEKMEMKDQQVQWELEDL